jgi:hypothetical protein
MASHRGGPGSRTSSMWGLWWTKRHWGRFFPSTSVSPANHSTDFSIIIITRGWHSRPLVAAVSSGPWFHPALYKLKKIKKLYMYFLLHLLILYCVYDINNSCFRQYQNCAPRLHKVYHMESQQYIQYTSLSHWATFHGPVGWAKLRK